MSQTIKSVLLVIVSIILLFSLAPTSARPIRFDLKALRDRLNNCTNYRPNTADTFIQSYIAPSITHLNTLMPYLSALTGSVQSIRNTSQLNFISNQIADDALAVNSTMHKFLSQMEWVIREKCGDKEKHENTTNLNVQL